MLIVVFAIFGNYIYPKNRLVSIAFADRSDWSIGPKSGGQFPAEQVVSLNRNGVVNFSEISTMGNDSSRCFCGRDFEYQHCHGRWIRVELNRQIEEVAAYMKTA